MQTTSTIQTFGEENMIACSVALFSDQWFPFCVLCSQMLSDLGEEETFLGPEIRQQTPSSGCLATFRFSQTPDSLSQGVSVSINGLLKKRKAPKEPESKYCIVWLCCISGFCFVIHWHFFPFPSLLSFAPDPLDLTAYFLEIITKGNHIFYFFISAHIFFQEVFWMHITKPPHPVLKVCCALWKRSPLHWLLFSAHLGLLMWKSSMWAQS